MTPFPRISLRLTSYLKYPAKPPRKSMEFLSHRGPGEEIHERVTLAISNGC